MARHRPLIWHLSLTFMAILAAAVVLIAVLSSALVKDFYDEQLEAELETSARLFAAVITGPLGQGDVEAIDAILDTVDTALGTRLTVILPDGTVVADTHMAPSLMEPHGDREEIVEAFAHGKGSATRKSTTLDAEMQYVAVAVVIDGHPVAVVRTARPVQVVADTIWKIRKKIAMGGGVVALLAFVMLVFLARRVSAPFVTLTEGSARFAAGDLTYRLRLPHFEEASALAAAMNDMATQLEDRLALIASQRNELEAVLSSMSEAVIVTDGAGTIKSLNASAASLLAIDAETCRGTALEEVVANEQLRAFIERIKLEGGAQEEEIVLVDHPRRIVGARGNTIEGEDTRAHGVLIVLRDVTRQKRLEVVRQDFVANVSHELKTPITSIKGFVETLRDGALDDQATARHFLDIIARHSDRLQAIVEDLLSLSRLEAEVDRDDDTLVEGDVADVVTQATRVCEHRAVARGISLEVGVEQGLRARINPILLQQALINLVDNAITYSDEGSVVKVEAASRGDTIHVAVTDHGIGIPAKDLPRIFERFYRVDKARSRKAGGTGLGLSIVKHIVNTHGGRVRATSVPDRGSTFTITIPALQSSPAPP